MQKNVQDTLSFHGKQEFFLAASDIKNTPSSTTE